MPTSKTRKADPQDFKKKKPASVAAASAFKKKSSTVLVELPSGNAVKVKRVDISSLLTDNIIPDSLTGMVQSRINPPKEEAEKPDDSADVAKLMQDPSKILDLFDVFDRIAAKVVVEPEFIYHKREAVDPEDLDKKVWEIIPEEDRDDDLVYTDEVDFEDKSFLFQYSVGGTADLERFRESTRTAMGSLEPQQSVQLPSE